MHVHLSKPLKNINPAAVATGVNVFGAQADYNRNIPLPVGELIAQYLS